MGRVLGAEAVVTFLPVLVTIAVAADDRVPKVAAGMAIGAALGAAILIGGPVSGAGVNPARAIGPMILEHSQVAGTAHIDGVIQGVGHPRQPILA